MESLVFDIAKQLAGINYQDLMPAERKIYEILREAGIMDLNQNDDLILLDT